MDIFFRDPNEVPLPPQEVRIRELRADPWPDSRRVRVYLEVDPFQKRPCADLVITDESGDEVAATSIIEPMMRKLELNMHLRNGIPGGNFTLRAVLFYSRLQQEQEAASDPLERMIVDSAEVLFRIE